MSGFNVETQCENTMKYCTLRVDCLLHQKCLWRHPEAGFKTPNISPKTEERHGSKTFYKLLEVMGHIHDLKSHDYASNTEPYGNYYFAGQLSQMFDDPRDAGFIGRIGDKLYRLSNLENNEKDPLNESVEDTENDLCVLMALWMASRRDRRT